MSDLTGKFQNTPHQVTSSTEKQ